MPVCTLFRPLVLRVVLPTLLLAFACSGYAGADTWSTGQFTTYQPTDWAAGGVASPLLDGNFLTVYPSATVITGDAAGFVDIFDSPAAISGYLPTSGSEVPLTVSSSDPTSDGSGSFGGDVLALKLDVDFSGAGVTLGSSGTSFGDLVLTSSSRCGWSQP